MSIKNENGKGNLLISYLFKESDFINQIEEENQLKRDIAELLYNKGYKFVIADDDLIDKSLVEFEESKLRVELEDVRTCQYCGKAIKENEPVYQVMVYHSNGIQEFLKVCSEKCANECKDYNVNIHNKRADCVERQCIQRLR